MLTKTRAAAARLAAWRPRRRPRPPRAPYELSGALQGARQVALVLIAAVVLAATVVALCESYHSLYVFALDHEVTRGWARWFPAMVDSFVVLGELALFVGVVDGWPARYSGYAWLVTLGGLSVSVAGNVGHLVSATLVDRCTAGIPPLAAFVGLTVGMMVLKRVLAKAGHVPADTVSAPSAPPVTMSALVTLLSAVADNRDTKSIVTALIENGIEDTGTIATIAGVTDRTVRRHKAGAAEPVPDPVAASVGAPVASPVGQRDARRRHAAGQARLTTVGAEGGA